MSLIFILESSNRSINVYQFHLVDLRAEKKGLNLNLFYFVFGIFNTKQNIKQFLITFFTTLSMLVIQY